MANALDLDLELDPVTNVQIAIRIRQQRCVQL
jgi:hypothetical protein